MCQSVKMSEGRRTSTQQPRSPAGRPTCPVAWPVLYSSHRMYRIPCRFTTQGSTRNS